MKFSNILLAAVGLSSFAQAAITYTEDFSSGTGEFDPLNQTVIDTSSGSLEFVHQNQTQNPPQPGQGAGVVIPVNDPNVLSSTLSDLLLDGNGAPIPGASVFFEFSTIVPTGTGAQDELGFFLGPEPNQAQSSDIFNGQNNNAFTLFVNDQGLFAQNNGQISNNPNSVSDGTNGASPILQDLGVGTQLTINIEWSLVAGANNGLASIYTVTAEGIDETTGAPVTATGMFDGIQQNLNANTIDQYAFVASSTQSITGSIDNFTVSNMPIPEPSSIVLSLVGISALFLRKRRK